MGADHSHPPRSPAAKEAPAEAPANKLPPKRRRQWLRAGSEFGLQGAPNNPLAGIHYLRRKFRPQPH